MTDTSDGKPWIPEFVLLAALWGASFLFTRLAVVDFGVLPTAALRVGVAALFLTPLLALRGQWIDLRRYWPRIMVIGFFNSGVPFALYSYALLSITTGLSAILNATVPLFGALIAWAWLRDRPGASRVLGLVLGFAGVALLAGDSASFKPGGGGLAVLACLLATFFYAAAGTAAKQYLGGIAPLAVAAGSQIGASAGLLLPAIWLWPANTPGLQAWVAIAFAGVVCTGLAYVLYFRLIVQIGPARSMAVTFLVPVFSVIYGVLFLHEAVTHWMLLCGAVIICGTALATGLVRLGRQSPGTG